METVASLPPLDNGWFDELLREYEERETARRERRENPYVLYLIKVLWVRRNGLRRHLAIDLVRSLRQSRGLPMPKRFDETVQSAFQGHAGESDVFRGAPDDDLFYWPLGKGTGIWAVRQDAADAWLKRKRLPDV